MRNLFVLSSASAAFLALALPALAQTTAGNGAPNMDDALAAAQNQLGLLEFCQAEGHIDGTAVETQKKMMAMLPAAIDTAKVEAGYTLGREGKLSVAGVEQDLTQIEAQGGKLADVCGEMAKALEAAAAQMGG